ATGGWATTIGVAIASLAVIAAAPRPATRVLPPVVIVTAAVLGAGRASPRPMVAPPPWADGVEAVRGTAVTAPLRAGLSQSFVIRTTEVETDSGWTEANEQLCVTTGPEATVGLGDRLWLSGRARRIDDIETRYRPVMRSRGCGASMFAPFVGVDAAGSGWRRTMAGARDDQSGVLRRLAPGDAGALMSGLVTGDDEALSRGAQDAFVETGTTHITAVSGSNFSTLLVAFIVAGRVTGWRRRLLWLLVVVTAIWAYAVFVGLNPPATRAAIVATGATLAVVAGRRPEIVTLIVLAAAAMVVVDPVLVWNLSFQLSLVASLAIAAVASVTAESTWRSWSRGHSSRRLSPSSRRFRSCSRSPAGSRW
ncbi:MAG TPA: ComEC/Rec2 family competence protein, partial [Thermomicrobiales bacterium]|nr:ComEC/Rec2 family competence protein [Thermomicrobiales bacterium]